MGDMSGMMGGMGASMGGLDLMTVLKYVLITLGGGALLGFVAGKVFAGIRYPNPEKRQLFNAWQKVVVLVVTILSIGLIVGALVYKPASPEVTDPLAVSGETGQGEAGADAKEGGTADAGGYGGGYAGGGTVMIGGGGSVAVMVG